ncbi:DUF1700 domain-containing protein [Paraburkholderia sp. GAS82]|uniref:DUF1700 domain-containing protein n=1 Tax=Paraburkholderia sp. GAS82 TaxID=3035137 RepID=UPI003D250770
MKQEVFIEALRQELSSLPKPAVDEIIADYREYIGDALAAGRREEEVIAALGDPVKLARELKAQASYRQWQDRRSFGNLIRVIMSISALGLLNVLLLIPFMVYLALLTAGYAVSVGLTIAGLVGVIALSGHHFFGKNAHDVLPFSFSSSEHAKGAHDFSASAALALGASDASGTQETNSNASDSDTPGNLKGLKIVGDRFVIDLQDDSKLSLVTRAGAIEIKKDDDNFKFEATSDAARQLLTKEKDGTWSIARDDVVDLDLKDDDEHVSLARTGKDAKSMVWDISTDDGDHVTLQEDQQGKPNHVTAQSGSDSVDIGDGKVAIDDGHHKIRVAASESEYTYAIVMLPIGLIGLALCIWLTRITWRAVSRYVKRQLDVVSASLDRQQPS